MPDLQSRSGLFAGQIREMGSYSVWAKRFPDWRKLAPTPHGFFLSRERFAQAWLNDERITLDDCANVELYPWHSVAFDAKALRPDLASDPIRRLVIEPAREAGSDAVLAFGKPFFDVLPALGFRCVFELSTRKGDKWPGAPKDRVIRVLD
jgi:hypothetical protein